MGLSFAIIALCLALGGVAWLAGRRPGMLEDMIPDIKAGIGAGFKSAELKRFSPKNTLFLIGPTPNHAACRLQRRLLKPAIAAFIREDITVIEVYGDARPRKNGEEIDWLDASLLRHAMDAEQGFYLIYVDEAGKTVVRSEAPMVAADILARAGLDAPAGARDGRRRSAVLKRLKAA